MRDLLGCRCLLLWSTIARCVEGIKAYTARPTLPIFVHADARLTEARAVQSAQRSRIRKMQHVSDLQTTVARLQSEVSSLSPQVAFLRQKLAGGTCTV